MRLVKFAIVFLVVIGVYFYLGAKAVRGYCADTWAACGATSCASSCDWGKLDRGEDPTWCYNTGTHPCGCPRLCRDFNKNCGGGCCTIDQINGAGGGRSSDSAQAG